MKIEVLITPDPLRMEKGVALAAALSCGAVVRFDGIVRGMENGHPIDGLDYEAYQPMAENTIRRILRELADAHPFEFARVHHRIGFVPVGEAAISMEIHSKHRGEAFVVLETFMDRLKQDVPIWKGRATFQVASEDNREQDARAPL